MNCYTDTPNRVISPAKRRVTVSPAGAVGPLAIGPATIVAGPAMPFMNSIVAERARKTAAIGLDSSRGKVEEMRLLLLPESPGREEGWGWFEFRILGVECC